MARAQPSVQVVAAIYGAAIGTTTWASALEAIAGAMGARLASLMQFGPVPAMADDRIDSAVMPGKTASMAEYIAKWYDRDPRRVLSRHLANPSDDRQIISDRLIGPADRDALKQFHEGWLRQHDLGDFAAAPMMIGDRRGALILQRASSAPMFSNDEIDDLRELGRSPFLGPVRAGDPALSSPPSPAAIGRRR